MPWGHRPGEGDTETGLSPFSFTWIKPRGRGFSRGSRFRVHTQNPGFELPSPAPSSSPGVDRAACPRVPSFFFFFAIQRRQSSNSCPECWVRVPRGFGVSLPGGGREQRAAGWGCVSRTETGRGDDSRPCGASSEGSQPQGWQGKGPGQAGPGWMSHLGQDLSL